MCTCSSWGRWSTVSEAIAQSSRCFCEMTSRLYSTPVKNSDRSRASPLSKRFQWSNPTALVTPRNSVALVLRVRSRTAASSMSPMPILSVSGGGRLHADRSRGDWGDARAALADTGEIIAQDVRDRLIDMLNPHIFRAYDVRGRVGSDINPEVFAEVGRAYATLIRRNRGRTVAVGQDNRESSASLKAAFTDGVRAAGVDVVDVGQVTTPMLYFATAPWRLDGGANITGSHNPVDYNGVKMVHPGAAPLSEDEIQPLRGMIERSDFGSGAGALTTRSPREDYIDVVTRLVRPTRPLKVVADAGNGVAGLYGPDLLRRIGCEVIELHCESDGRFPNHLPDPEDPANVVDLQARLGEGGAGAGGALCT